MTLVALEGVDNVGKTTLITQLIDKYPELYGYSFPTYPIEDIDVEQCTIDELFGHHFRFLKDLASNQGILKEHDANGVVVLLDRYFYSNYAYFMEDFIYYSQTHGIPLSESKEFCIKLDDLLTSFYKELIQPDLIVFLNHPSPVDKLETVQMSYDMIFESPKLDNLERVRALQPHTFEVVEGLLKDRGYI